MTRTLKMKFAGRFIDLLGHQMYGGPVPSVAEFIANSWDADSKKVEVTIPEDVTKPYAEIVIRDFGEGMSFDEINEFYLTIGYERRLLRGERTTSERLVMGRKGIGKLAGFGIAGDITIRSIKKGHLTQFNMNYEVLKSKKQLEGYEFFPDIDKETDEETGVYVILKNLKIQRNINIDSFRRSMSRRFALNTELMSITINGKALQKENLEFEYRAPNDKNSWAEEEIPDFGKIKFWFGFLKETIKDKELRGISIFSRERVAQFTPFHFNLSGGINGQVGLEYLTGQVKAEVLDSSVDHIATPRQTVNWQFGKAPLLEKWGQNKIKELCRDWKKRKDQRNLNKFKHNYSEFFPIINALPNQEKNDLMFALEKIAGLERIQEDDFRTIAKSMISGIERESVKKVIKRINVTSENALPELFEIIKEWDIISAVSTAEVVFGKVEIINQFKKYIDERLPEKKSKDKIDMQKFIKSHPWLLGHEYEDLQPADFHHEKGIDKWIEEELKIVNNDYKDKDGRRFDLLCIKNDWQIVILELMRPGLEIDYDHVVRLNRYVTRIQEAIKKAGTNKEFRGKNVFGILIADNKMKDTSIGTTLQALRHNMDTFTWKGLFNLVQSRYKEYLDILRMKAPDDPRIKGLVNLDEK
ncbi:MAG: ATP-binding protein [Candidatus Marinimicrobia bacterium]|nr:ATP-binding protein [Candidatus Neomarinimicrobiota bacterium]